MSTSVKPEPQPKSQAPSNLPPIPRVLSPDEFDQARTMSPAAISQAQFPVVPPPYVPKQGTAMAPAEATRTGAQAKNTASVPQTGLPRILTQYGFAPLAEGLDKSPVSTALSFTPPGAMLMAGVMGRDIAQYMGQKVAESQLDAATRKLAEADPERIPGERAAVEAIMLGAAPLIHEGIKAVKGGPPPGPPIDVQTRARVFAGLDPKTQSFVLNDPVLRDLFHPEQSAPPAPPSSGGGAVSEGYADPALADRGGTQLVSGKGLTPDQQATLDRLGVKRPLAPSEPYDPEAFHAIAQTPDLSGAEKSALLRKLDIPVIEPARLRARAGSLFPQNGSDNPFVKSDPTLDGTKVVDQAGEPVRVYHGTSAAFDSFDVSKNDPKALYGPGLYFTEDPKVAGGAVADDGGIIKKGYTNKGAGATPNVRPARLAIKNPFDADALLGEDNAPDDAHIISVGEHRHPDYNWDFLRERLDQANEDHNVDGGEFWRTLAHTPDEHGVPIGPRKANDILKAAGYDGITHMGGGNTGTSPHRVWIAFDPSQVRSPWGPTAGAPRYGVVKTSDGATPVSPDAPATLKVRAHMADVADAWSKIFAPAARTPEAGQAASILRATTGRMAAQYEQASFKLDEFRRAIDPLSQEDKLAFIDAIETGNTQPNPVFQAPADQIRATLDQAREQVQALGTGKLESFIQNYFPHIWADPEKAGTAFEAAKATAGTKSPMEGSKSFLKQRTIPTTAEGIAMGLEPVSYNPVDLTLLKLREMQRYVMAHQSLNEMKDAGLVQYVKAGELRPDGARAIDDRIATVFGPKQGAVSLPGEANIEPSDVAVHGTRIMGQYYAPEPVATVVNNYLSPGLRGNAIFDAYRGLGNSLNQAQLGLSAFHLGMTSLDASVSRVALGLEHLASGDVGEGLKAITSAPAAPVTNFLSGRKVMAAFRNPETASPEMQSIVNAVQEAGGRFRMDSFYKNSAAERLVQQMNSDAVTAGNESPMLPSLTAGRTMLPAALEMAAKPLMEHIVPMQKLGVFADLAKKAIADLPPEATLMDRRQALQRAWDSVDNRMGQLVYDNLFWNKTFKDLSMASVRSVGWNIGTIREIGGGLGDMASAAKTAVSGETPDVTHRMAYVVALPITVGMMGAAYQYLRTGEGPAELKDYFYPKTGETDADGNAERVQMPSYMKDVMAYSGHPWETVKHKMAPLPSAVYEMLQNQDFYGDQIRNPLDPMTTQLQQEANYLGKTILPFGIRNMQEQQARGDQSMATLAGSFVGVTPAPRKEVRSDAQNRMADYLSSTVSGMTPEQADVRKTKQAIIAGLRGNQNVDLDQAIGDAVIQHQITPKAVVQLLKEAGSTPAQEKFKRLTLEQALDVFQRSTDQEKAKFAGLLVKKISRAGSE